MHTVLLAAMTYFGIVFSTGFVLGVARVLLLVPLVGEQTAQLLEIPVMTVLCYACAYFVVRKFAISSIQLALLIGALALIVLLIAECAVVLAVGEMSIAEYLQSRDSLAGYAYAVSLMLYAVFPVLSVYLRKDDDFPP